METAQLTRKSRVITNHQDLIKGEFTPEEAKEIISHLFSEKINFHGMKSFSNKVRFGEVDHASEARIVELKQSNSELNQFIKTARLKGKKLRITSTVSIKLV
ncbi:hypothetical protein [Algoriphagus sp.]|uniref:hypothetical protein n=1 Tax=Algoriphagus sp. TaxID=1872435 RepID=UPI0032980F0F